MKLGREVELRSFEDVKDHRMRCVHHFILFGSSQLAHHSRIDVGSFTSISPQTFEECDMPYRALR